jgi:hypothetical protein
MICESSTQITPVIASSIALASFKTSGLIEGNGVSRPILLSPFFAKWFFGRGLKK